ncbi:tyrosine-type recombinase/integrase [Herbidospora sp. RD11066]
MPQRVAKICLAAFKLRKELQEQEGRRRPDEWQKSNLVFTTRYGGPVEPRNFNRRFDRRISEADVRRITVHGTRGTCATLLAALDVHPRVTMRILRHSQISVTMEVHTEALRRVRQRGLRNLVAVLYGCTTHQGPLAIICEWPLTTVGVAGFEPTASSSRRKTRLSEDVDGSRSGGSDLEENPGEVWGSLRLPQHGGSQEWLP